MKAKVLVVDDEPSILDLVSASLGRADFEVQTVRSGREALLKAPSFAPDLILLDVMMPGFDGFETARSLKENGVHSPIIFLTARDTIEDKVEGYGTGGEDYITKPFSLDELTARIRAVLRRTLGAKPISAHLTFGDIELDEDSRSVFKAGAPVNLSPTEFSLLRYLMRNPNKVLSKNDILEHVWGPDFTGEPNVVESYVSYLRKKVDNTEPPLIHTLRSAGYMLRKPLA